MTTCGVCNQTVDIKDGPHVHDPKICRACQRSLPAASFAPHASSGDGRRHQCRECVAADRPAPLSAEQREERRIREGAAVKADRNQRLRGSGYRWVIQSPDGRILSIQQAEEELDAIDAEDSQSYWDELPPGSDL